MPDKQKVKQGIMACADFCCGECPYQHLYSLNYPLRCIHVLMVDIYALINERN